MIRPKRIQCRRTKGWRMPHNAVYVGRGTRWGNAWVVGERHPDDGHTMTRREVVDLYRKRWADAPHHILADVRRLLGGKPLVCWCRLDQECHADVLLDVANARVVTVPGDFIEGSQP